MMSSDEICISERTIFFIMNLDTNKMLSSLILIQ